MVKAMEEAVEISPGVLKYAMESSGYDSGSLAKKINVSKEDVDAWLAGNKRPSLTKLKEISKATKYNLAVLLLEKAPKIPSKPKDYRSANKLLVNKTLLAIRKARNVQSLYTELGGSPEAQKISLNKYSIDTAPESAADKERGLLAIELKGSGESGARELLRKYISVLEKNNILVLQLPMPLDNCRGFSIKDKNPFVIALSSKDEVYPRLFTLFHEFAHLVLQSKDGAMCIPEESALQREDSNIARVETWCNKFAATFLLPESRVRTNSEVSGLANLIKTTDFSYKVYKQLKSISRKHMVSYLAFLIRLKSLNLISEAKYNRINEAYKTYAKKEAAGVVKSKKGRGGAKPDVKAINRNGEKFTTLVVRGVKAGKIDYYDAVEYLNANIRTIDKLATRLG